MSKMGIAVISSYRGGYNFEAVGLSRSLVNDLFPGMPAKISGEGYASLHLNAQLRHDHAFDPAVATLPIGGFYRQRHTGETHAYSAQLMHLLQTAVATDSYSTYQKFSRGVAELPPVYLRDLLQFNFPDEGVPVDQVEAITEIRKRFVTPGMSLGALSPEAHETLAIAMNRIGAKAVSGEGGEDKVRYTPVRKWRQRQFGGQADRQRAVRRHRRISQRVRRDRDQGRARREARRGRAAARLQGDRVHRQVAPCDAGRDADFAAAAPRHLFDRRPRAAHLRPQADQSARACVREAGQLGRDRHGRRGRGKGACRRHPRLRPCRRYRRVAADQHQICRHAVGNGAVGGQPDADAQRPARAGEAAHRRRAQDRARHRRRGDPRRRGIRHRHAQPSGDGLHHGAAMPFEHLPGRHLHAGRAAARQVRRIARKGHQPDDLHRRGSPRHPRAAGVPQPRRSDRPHRIAPPGQPRRRASRRSRPQPDPRQGRCRRRPAPLQPRHVAQRGARQPRRADDQGCRARSSRAARRCS